MKIDNQLIDYIGRLIISVLLALEVSIPPNPYKEELIIALVLYICFRYDVSTKILSTIKKWVNGNE